MTTISPYDYFRDDPPFEHLKSVLPYELFSEVEWREFILAFCNEEEHPEKQNILQYLACSDDNFHILVFGWSNDPLTSEPIGPTSQHTDNVWVWQMTVPYFVEKYNIPLPEEFIEHMRNNNWVCPKRSPTELTEETVLAMAEFEFLPGVAIRR